MKVIIALREAATKLGRPSLQGTTVFTVVEPCPMCVSTCRQARLDLVIWGADDPKAGACGSKIDLAGDLRLGPPLANRGGLEAAAGRRLLELFFAKRR